MKASSISQRLLLVILVCCFEGLLAQTFTLSTVSPTRNAFAVSPSSNIVLTFSKPVQNPIANALYVYSEQRGRIIGTTSVSGNTLTFNPQVDLQKGDVIVVNITTNVKSSTSEPLTTPLQYHFVVATAVPPVQPPVFKAMPITYSGSSYDLQTLLPADLDKDGDADIVGGSVWFENDGNENFTERPIGTVGGIYDLKVCDLDHDGDMDIIPGSYYGVKWLLNDGSMNFTEHQFPGSGFITSISIADNNNDGIEDILFADQQMGVFSLNWLIGNGDGTFTKTTVTTDFVYKAVPLDVNNDGLLDIAAEGENSVFVLHNTGSTFNKVLLDTSGDFYDGLVAEDLNGDSHIDIVASDRQKALNFINDGSGIFTKSELPVDSYFGGNVFGVADIDGDGDPDPIAKNGYYMEFYENGGANTFIKRQIKEFQRAAYASAPGDIDSDGDIDIVYYLQYGGLGWAKNTTAGEAIPFQDDPLGDIFPEQTSAAAWADYDLDGDQDVLVSGFTYPNLFTTLYKKTSTGLEVAAEFPGISSGNIEWFDFENDGDPDFIVTGATTFDYSSQNPSTRIYINDNGTFTLLAASTSIPASAGDNHVKVADVNSDGKCEILLTGEFGGVYTYRNATFEKVFAYGSTFTSGRVALSDVDRDGDLDFAVTGWRGNDEMGTMRSVFINEGDFKFTERANTFNGIISGNLLFQDFNVDGHPDLAAIGIHRINGYNLASSSFYKNTGSGFEKIVSPETGASIYVDVGGAAAAGDFDNDGHPDVLTQYGWYAGLKFFSNDKLGWFTDTGFAFPGVNQYASFIAAADYDNDQDLDLLSGNTLVRNNVDNKNQRPVAPPTLSDSVRNNYLYMYWSGATDAETPVSALTYQVYVGSTVSNQNIISSNANLANGNQFIQREGSARKTWKVKVPTVGTYYWGVQAIDAGLMTSPFSIKKSVNVIYIEGEQRSCTNTPQRYKAFPAGNYTWTVNGGQVQSSTGDEIVIIWNVGSGSVSASNGTAKNTLDIHIVEKPVPQINGNDVACELSSGLVYETPHDNNHSYAWTIEDGTFLRSSDSSRVFVAWGQTGDRKIHVFETSAGNICTVEQILTVSIKAKPSPVIHGKATLCIESPSQQYDIKLGAGNSVEWTVFGGEIQGSSTAADVSVRWDDQAIGRITVTETNAFCSATEILEVDLRVLTHPDITGQFVVCNNSDLFQYSTEPAAGYSYSWNVEGGILNGANNNRTISVKWNKSGTGKILLEQKKGNCLLKDSVYVNVYPSLDDFEIIANNNNNTLTAPAAIAYQWFFDGSPIDEATNKTYDPKEAGVYTVTITDTKGCSATSADMPFPVMEIENGEFELSVYPNPVASDLYVEIENDYRGPIQFTIRDVLGRTLFKTEAEKVGQHFKQKLSLQNATSDFLLLDVNADRLLVRKKLVIERN